MTGEDLLTAAKIAEKLGIPAAKVTRFIKDNAVEPDKTKGACKYYGTSKQAQIEKGIK